MREDGSAELSVICMQGCERFGEQVEYYLKDWRKRDGEVIYLTKNNCPRFGTGEGKCVLNSSVRGHDVYIICDIFNYGVTFKMYGMEVPMSPDDHYADLKRIIAAAAGRAKRITVIMPMLYEGRQHRRSARESLDCAVMLQELNAMGVSDLLTFDAHDPRICNATPLHGFDNVQPTYQMLKALVRNYPDIRLDKEHLMMISPDEGAMQRSMYYSSVLGVDIGMFYKRRDYSVVVNGRNPIIAHQYLGSSVKDKDVIVVDDMISSGDSMIDVAKQLKQQGAKRIFVFSTFGLFTAGFERFDQAVAEGMITRIFTTNLNYRREEILTRPWYCEVNMCKYVAYLIETLNHDMSISSLIDPVKRIQALLEKHNAALAAKESV